MAYDFNEDSAKHAAMDSVFTQQWDSPDGKKNKVTHTGAAIDPNGGGSFLASIMGGGGANGEGMQGPTVAAADPFNGMTGAENAGRPAQAMQPAGAQPAAIQAAMSPQTQPSSPPGLFSRMGQGLQWGLGYNVDTGTHIGATPQVGLSQHSKQFVRMNPAAFTPQAIAAASQPGGGVFDGMTGAENASRPAPSNIDPTDAPIPGTTLADLMGPQGPTAAEFAQSAANMRTNGFSPEANARMDAAAIAYGMIPGTPENARMRHNNVSRNTPTKEQTRVAVEQNAATVAAQNQANAMALGAQGNAAKLEQINALGLTEQSVAQIHADAAQAGLAMKDETAIEIAKARAKRESDPQAALGDLYKAYGAAAGDEKTQAFIQQEIASVRGGGAPVAQASAQVKSFKGRKYQLKPGGNATTQADWQDIGAA